MVTTDGPSTKELADGRNNRFRFRVQEQPVPQRQRQKPRGTVVQWQQFLPFVSVRVLLVENDDSTRHLVSALLRNCSYEVTAVANCLEAWKTLENPTDRIDLVLTEILMPSLSGIGLLAKILSHKACKNIPLIMMSSNDSMGIVFKCLSKGAVDFLVKPIRKNELKNLWQHVWRKSHIPSFSGSDSGIRIQNSSLNSTSLNMLGYKNGSNGEDDNWNTNLNVKDSSGSESGTQYSMSKEEVEGDSAEPMAQWEPPSSSSAHGISSRLETLADYWIPSTDTRECNEEGDNLVAMGKYLELGSCMNQVLHLEEPSRKIRKIGMSKQNNSNSELSTGREQLEKETAELNSTKAGFVKLRKDAYDFVDVITNSIFPGCVTNEDDVSNCINIKDKTSDGTEKSPRLELESNTPGDGDTGRRTTGSEQNVLIQSDLSAFSRYKAHNTMVCAHQAQEGNVGSCSPPDNSSEAEKFIINLESNSNSGPNQHNNGSSSNDDMGSTTNNMFPVVLVNAHTYPALQSLKYPHYSSTPVTDDNNDPVETQERITHQQVQSHHHYHHYHHHHQIHHHVENRQQTKQLPDRDNLSSRSFIATASHLEPSSLPTAPIEGNAANYSLNISSSGSNNRSNGENGSNEKNAYILVGTSEGTNVASENGGLGKSGADDVNERARIRNGVDQNQWARREAALSKFREKRKDRCFGKKVRYENRKILAEGRPRVKGQFVKARDRRKHMEEANS